MDTRIYSLHNPPVNLIPVQTGIQSYRQNTMNNERLTFLAELKKASEAEDVPNVTLTNAKFLHFLAGMKQAQSVLEIGTANGYSTIWLADAVEPFDGNVVTIDHSEPSRNWALKNFEACNLKNIESLFGRAQGILENMNTKFDLIFVDAIKKSYGEFWKLCKPLMNKNAIVIFDDVLKFPEKTAHFHELMEQETEYEKVILPIDEDDGVMLVQKKNS